MFSGDIYLSAKVKFFHFEENISEHIKSLKKILSYDFNSVFCSHNPVMKNGKKRIKQKLAYFEDIVGQVLHFSSAGIIESEIINRLDKGYDQLFKALSMGELSFKNMIRSALRTI